MQVVKAVKTASPPNLSLTVINDAEHEILDVAKQDKGKKDKDKKNKDNRKDKQ